MSAAASATVTGLLSKSPAYIALQAHYEAKGKHFKLSDAFSADADRAKKLSHTPLTDVPFHVDLSKHLVDDEALDLLLALAKERGVSQAIGDMFSGKRINTTEDRAVLHTALRAAADDKSFKVDGSDQDVIADVESVREKMGAFAEEVRSGARTGFTGKKFETVINIGIGGSDLGPVMVHEALKPLMHPRMSFHFVSNVDSTHVAQALAGANPETTLVIVCSKTFTTIETMTNANTARDWLLKGLGGKTEAVASHFVAVSTNAAEVTKFGIDVKNMFGFWEWVGGRYSIWGAIGLSLVVGIGADGFREFLAGARAMDQHFLATKDDLSKNVPALLGVIGAYYVNCFGARTHAILPYSQLLTRFAAYFQQADMESNGKYVTKEGEVVDYSTGPVVWGEPGTNGQHAFYQLIHQGTSFVPADFIGVVHGPYESGKHQTILLANFLAQTQALMVGRSETEVAAALRKASGKSADAPLSAQEKTLVQQKTFQGNRPTTSIVVAEVSPFTLGSLVAMYEHKIFVQGVLWGINSFDQWGVELGKVLAVSLTPFVGTNNVPDGVDSSTAQLLGTIKSILDQEK